MEMILSQWADIFIVCDIETSYRSTNSWW